MISAMKYETIICGWTNHRIYEMEEVMSFQHMLISDFICQNHKLSDFKPNFERNKE